MWKKLIAVGIATLMALSAGTGVLAAERGTLVPVSGENLTTSDANNSSNSNTLNKTTETIDNSVAQVEQNRTPSNNMLNTNLDESNALSKYGTSKVSVAGDIAGTTYAEAAELLGALGIMVGDAETGLFRPNDNILRSEMAKVAVYSIGYEDIAINSNHQTRFPDVVSNHWANGAINVAEQQGMVIGDDVGTFRPDDNVTLQEAVTIMVRAMGYEPKAQSLGGFPAGYLSVASSNQLLKGISGSATTPASRGDIAQLVFNSLTTKLMEQTNFGSNVTYEVVDKTLLYDNLNVEKGYGQVVGTSETTLTGGSTVADDKIQINDNIYIDGENSAKQLLGYNVVYYARIDTNTDEKTLILVRPQDSKNNVISINAEDIVSVTGTTETDKTVTYWRDKDNDKTTKTDTIVAKPIYIYNGKYKAAVEISDLQPESGNLILLDTDVNNVYDIVFVNHFNNIVVDTYSAATGRVTDKYANGSLVFDPDSTTVDYTLIKDGEEIKPSELEEWNVISYTLSDDRNLIKAYVTTESITGTVTQSTTDGFRIDNSTRRYKVATSYPNTIALRDKGRFYLDYEGKIAAVDTTADITGTAIRGTYGYLVSAAITGTLEETLQIKIFTKAGATEIFDAASKIRVNNEYSLSPSEALSKISGETKDATITPQLITYETNSNGKISGIYTAVDKTETLAPNTEEFTLNIDKADQTYKSASNKLGNVTVGTDTLIFDIPSTAGTDTDRYAVRTRSMFSNDTNYDIKVYDLQSDYTAKVIIVTSSTGVTAAESPIFVVDEIAEGQNEDLEIVDMLTGYEDGVSTSLTAEDKNVFVKGSAASLQQGDILQYKTNAKGEVDAITLLFDVSKKTTEAITNVDTDLVTVYGKATKKFAGSVNVSVNNVVKNYITTGANVYYYDSTKKANNVTVVSTSDIELYETGNEVRIFLKLYKDVVTDIVLVK